METEEGVLPGQLCFNELKVIGGKSCLYFDIGK